MDGESEIFSRGSKRLDYAFGAQELAEFIVRIGLTPYDFVVSSDYRGLFIDFNVDVFLGKAPSHLMSPAIRGIRSNSTKQCRNYVEALTKYLIGHKVFERTTRAQNKTDMHGLTSRVARTWERINQDIF